MSTDPAHHGPPDAGHQTPPQIGPYRILATLGEGGMGTVYLAEQREPVRRRAAIKVIKLGMDSKAVLARFEAERKALAMMEHSCIATVYDAGITAQGQPYFSMEYVKGIPITEFCDQNKLGLHDRIGLFQKVCSGVQHAHLKGVMHRDLKPSNVLVTLQDGQPLPKIIDFGLAKATDHHLVATTIYTEQGQVIGTPEYMSPEQAGVGGLDVDTRTDVYSLGVLLYQLLTGELPFSRAELLRSGLLEMQRVIREAEPPRPSTKITTLGAQAEPSARTRRMQLVEFRRSLRGELDWIVMRAIEKDRNRRYATAQELAQDLDRHLRNEPVLAGPPSTWYRLRKMARRHRSGLVATAVGVTALATGLVIAVLQRDEAIEQRRAADVAKTEKEAVLILYRQLEDGERLAQFEREADRLVPETSANAERIADWVNRVQAWLAAMPNHRRALQELRQRGSERDGRYTFPSFDLQFLHDQLNGLVERLERLRSTEGLQARMEDRLQWTRSVRTLTIDQHAGEWTAVANRVRNDPRFAATGNAPALEITPQEGLVPIGPDPQSKLEEFCFVRSGTIPKRSATGQLQIEDGMGLVFVLVPVPGGVTRIGSEEFDAPQSEKPVQEVPLSPYFLSKYEVTQAQWPRLSHLPNPSRYHVGFRMQPAEQLTESNPVESLSWSDIVATLSIHGLALPTEAQWEHACRAGATTEWFFGGREDLVGESGSGVVNIADGYDDEPRRRNGAVHPEARLWPDYEDGYVVHARVGSFPANAWGLHEMHGNVSEFTADVATQHYMGVRRAPADGQVTDQVDGKLDETSVMNRGGSFYRSAEEARSARRLPVLKDAKSNNIGFRPARAVRMP